MKVGELVVLWILGTAWLCAWAAEQAIPATVTENDQARFDAAMDELGPELLQWTALGITVILGRMVLSGVIALVVFVEAVRVLRRLWPKKPAQPRPPPDEWDELLARSAAPRRRL